MSSPSRSSGQPWSPVWKSLEECPQYECGILSRYINMRSQILQDFGNCQQKPPNWDRFLGFLNQVIESRGYDYENCPQEFFGKEFPLRIQPDYVLNNEAGRAHLTSQIDFVVRKINEEAQMHGEQYKYDGYVKTVDALGHRSTLLTMSLKMGTVVKIVQALVFTDAFTNAYDDYKLLEWRFKPA